MSSKVSLSILEPLQNLEILYSSISKNIETVESLNNLTKLNLHEIKCDNFNFLSSLKNLSALGLSLGSFKDFDGITKINNLQKLHIMQVRGFSNEVADSVLINCKRLWALKLDTLKHITALNFIKQMTELKYLSIEAVKNLESFNPILLCESLESLSGYQCKPKDNMLTGLRNLKNIGLGDSYTKLQIDKLLQISQAQNITIRGNLLRGANQYLNPFFPF